MFKRITFFAYGSISYLIFLGTFLYAMGFVGNFGVPTTLELIADQYRCSFRLPVADAIWGPNVFR